MALDCQGDHAALTVAEDREPGLRVRGKMTIEVRHHWRRRNLAAKLGSKSPRCRFRRVTRFRYDAFGRRVMRPIVLTLLAMATAIMSAGFVQESYHEGRVVRGNQVGCQFTNQNSSRAVRVTEYSFTYNTLSGPTGHHTACTSSASCIVQPNRTGTFYSRGQTSTWNDIRCNVTVVPQ